MLTQLQTNLEYIHSEVMEKLIPENIRKNIEILGVTGEYAPAAAEGVKMFSTIAEMQEDEDPKKGDLAIVYNIQDGRWDGNTTDRLKILDEFTLDEPYSENYSVYISFGVSPSSESSYIDFSIELGKTLCTIYVREYDYTQGTSIDIYTIQYTSVDGQNYTKTSQLPEDATYIEIEDHQIESYSEQYSIYNAFLITTYTFDGLYQYNGNEYELAKTQLTAQIQDILTDKIAYGKNGVVTGNDSIYDNLDTGKVLEKLYKLPKYPINEDVGDAPINIYGKIGNYLATSYNKFSILTYLKEDPNGDISLLEKKEGNIHFDISSMLEDYEQVDWFESEKIVQFDDYYGITLAIQYIKDGTTEFQREYGIFDKEGNLINKVAVPSMLADTVWPIENYVYQIDHTTNIFKRINLLDLSEENLIENLNADFSYCPVKFGNKIILLSATSYQYIAYSYDLINKTYEEILNIPNTSQVLQCHITKDFNKGLILATKKRDDEFGKFYLISPSGEVTIPFDKSVMSDFYEAIGIYPTDGLYLEDEQIIIEYGSYRDLATYQWHPLQIEIPGYDSNNCSMSVREDGEIIIDIMSSGSFLVVTDYTIDIANSKMIINTFNTYDRVSGINEDENNKKYEVRLTYDQYENHVPQHNYIITKSGIYTKYDISQIKKYSISNYLDYDLAVVNAISDLRLNNIISIDKLFMEDDVNLIEHMLDMILAGGIGILDGQLYAKGSLSKDGILTTQGTLNNGVLDLNKKGEEI